MKKKEKILIVALLVLMIVAVVGVSYAAFKFIGNGEKVNTITTGAVSMKYTESNNTISLNGALPTTDATGMVRLNPGEYFDFTVESSITGNVNINYEISAKDVTTAERKIDGSNIKLYLTKLNDDGTEEGLMTPRVYSESISENAYTGRPTGEMSLYTSNMNSSESNNYRLRMYVTEEYNPQGDGGNLSFSVQINVYGKDKVAQPVNKAILTNLGSNGSTYDDGEDTFITGEEPNNYIWYSGKLWRAVSVNNEAKTTKLVTQWDISGISYNVSGNALFQGSNIEAWLNDTTVDGFLGNLRDYENFIVTDAKWNATEDATESGSVVRPTETTIVTDAVGLLNLYEYQTSYRGTTYDNGYLNNGLYCWLLTPNDSSKIRTVSQSGYANSGDEAKHSWATRPSINLKSNVQIVDGDGTLESPYRLGGDNDKNLRGTKLSNRYSGEYIRFGNNENNLYRIVSHESEDLTKITSAEPLKDAGEFKTMNFGSNVTYSNANTIGTFLNGEYITNYVGSSYSDMISDSTTWYLGTVDYGASYKLAKYEDVNMSNLTSSTTDAKVGLLRVGELMSGQFARYSNKGSYNDDGITIDYWTLTPFDLSDVNNIFANGNFGTLYYKRPIGVRPSMNLKSNVIITSGEGTKEKPFEITLGS